MTQHLPWLKSSSHNAFTKHSIVYVCIHVLCVCLLRCMVCIEYRFFVATQESSEKLSSHDDISLMTEELSSHDGVVSRTHERVMSDTWTSHDSEVIRLSSHDGAFLLAFAAFAPLFIHTCVTWLVQMSETTRSCARDTTHSCVCAWHDSSMHSEWHDLLCGWHDSFICVTDKVDLCCLCSCTDSYICVTRLAHVLVTWLIRIYQYIPTHYCRITPKHYCNFIPIIGVWPLLLLRNPIL